MKVTVNRYAQCSSSETDAAKWNSAIKMLFTCLHNQLLVVPLEVTVEVVNMSVILWNEGQCQSSISSLQRKAME